MGPTAPERRVLQSVGTRLALATAVLVLLVAAAVQYALVRYLQREQLRAKRDAATMVAALFAELSSAPVVFGDDQGIRESLGYLRSNPEVLEAAVFAARPEGSLGEALGTLPRADTHQSNLRAPSRGSVGTLQQAHDTLDVSQWINDPSGKRIGAVVLRFSLARERRSAALLEQRTWQISLGLAGLLTVSLLLLARIYIISPLRSVHAAVHELRAGGPSGPARTHLPLTARDEVGDLARGFLSMAEAIEGREAAIAEQNRQMRLVLDNVGEGFLVLDARGAIEGQHSAVLASWFGTVSHGQPLWEYLRPHDPEQAEWLELAWANIGQPGMPLELCVQQMPRAWTAGTRHYQVDYRPLTGANQRLDAMVVTISDVTELKLREQAELEQRELVAVFSGLIRDRTGFVSFCEDARLLIDNMSAPNPPADYDLTEHLHTIKGNAFLFRLREFGDACEQVETLCEAQQRSPRSEDAARLSEAFANAIRPIEPFLALERGHNLQLSQEDYDAIVRTFDAHEAAPEVLSLLRSATAEPADAVLSRFAERLQVLARRLGKCPTQVECMGHGLRFPRETFEPLWSVIVHVLRNIADHGLETAWDRERNGKPRQASVRMSAAIERSALELRFHDDGRGIDWEKVRARAEQRGMAATTRADLVTALLCPHFTTLDETGALSGRGVGLAALQHEVAALGGTIRIESELGQGTELTIVLPASLVVAA